MPMFPNSGVPAGEAINTLPEVTSVPCDELWYSTSRCQPRFDPAAANAMLAEDMNVVMKGEVQYDCLKLDNLERAIRYIVQRGLPRAAYLTGGPQNYITALDPKATRYNNFMTLTIVTAMTNIANVTLNVDGLGVAPIRRNDKLNLEAGDLRAGMPYIIAFIDGVWYMCGLAASQVPIIVKGGLDFWIRTDGNDITGDGTANTPDKAFKTIAGCWYAVGSRYAATPSFSINMKIGLAGTYDGALIGPFGGNVSLTGDVNNPAAYRIRSVQMYQGMYTAIWNQGIKAMQIYGVSLLMDGPVPQGNSALQVVEGGVALSNCRIEVLTNNPNGTPIGLTAGLVGQTPAPGTNHSYVDILGNGNSVYCIIYGERHSSLVGAWLIAGQTVEWHYENMNVLQRAFTVTSLSTFHWGGSQISFTTSGVTGSQYQVNENSILSMGGKTPPGTTAGTAALGGIYIP